MNKLRLIIILFLALFLTSCVAEKKIFSRKIEEQHLKNISLLEMNSHPIFFNNISELNINKILKNDPINYEINNWRECLNSIVKIIKSVENCNISIDKDEGFYTIYAIYVNENDERFIIAPSLISNKALIVRETSTEMIDFSSENLNIFLYYIYISKFYFSKN